MHETQRTIHSGAVEGEYSDICAEVPPIFEDTIAMTKPIVNRHGSVIRQGSRSFLSGVISQSFNLFTFSSRYQIKASDGILYVNIRTSSAAVEKPGSAAFAGAPVEPEKNRTTYKMRVSIYIPIISVLAFPNGIYVL